MNCTIHDALDDADLAFIRKNLTKPGSDFHRKLRQYQFDGAIALVRDQSEIVGWARTEPWQDADGDDWNTLEAFVSPNYRHMGVSVFAAAGIAAAVLRPGPAGVAVFHPVMYIVANRVGLRPTLFSKGWVRGR